MEYKTFGQSHVSAEKFSRNLGLAIHRKLSARSAIIRPSKIPCKIPTVNSLACESEATAGYCSIVTTPLTKTWLPIKFNLIHQLVT